MSENVSGTDDLWASGDMPAQTVSSLAFRVDIPYDQAQDNEIRVHAVNSWLDTFSESQIQSTSAQNASAL